ncbi:MAG: tetratricopeptide repeat protein [Myxococcota bacterium]
MAAGLAAVVLVLAVTYAPILDAGFLTYDDDKYVTANPVVQAGLTAEGVTWAFSSIHDANWIPLVWISLMLDSELHGPEPRGYHATNVGLHALATVLLFAALYRLTRAPWRSLFVAGLFALHPLHVQSVAWIAERKDVLSGFFWMATLLAYTFHVERPSLLRYLAMAISFALGLLCKATLVTLPFALLLLDFWPGNRLATGEGGSRALAKRGAWLVAEKLPLMALSALASGVTLMAQGRGGAIRMAHLDWTERVANALLSYVVYVRRTFWPSDLSFFHPHPEPQLGSPEVWAAAAGLGAATAALVYWAGRSAAGRPACVGWLWFLGTLVPMLGIVQVGGQGMADRYMYIPLVGLGVAVAYSWPAWQGARARAGLGVSAVAFVATLAVCALLTRIEVPYWRDSESLYGRAIELEPHNPTAHYELARHLNAHARHAEAEAHAREAVRMVPLWSDAYLNLGAALIGQGRHSEGIAAIRRAVVREPGSSEARLVLASAFIETEQLAKARAELRTVIQMSPESLTPRLSLGSIEERLGHRAAAFDQYEVVWRSAPGTAEGAAAAGRLAQLVDGWPEAPPRSVTLGRIAAEALSRRQPETFGLLARRLGGRPGGSDADVQRVD